MSCSVEELYTIENASGNDGLSFTDQVYKIVVQWSDGSSTIIYRRYSMFFDFQVRNDSNMCVCMCVCCDSAAQL